MGDARYQQSAYDSTHQWENGYAYVSSGADASSCYPQGQWSSGGVHHQGYDQTLTSYDQTNGYDQTVASYHQGYDQTNGYCHSSGVGDWGGADASWTAGAW